MPGLPVNPEQPAAEEGIDFAKLAQGLGRQWRLVLACSAGGLATAGLITALSPRVWQAEFEIVLNNETGGIDLGSVFSQSGSLGALIGGIGVGPRLGSLADNQATEMKVLVSPLVLRPAFEDLSVKLPTSLKSELDYGRWAAGVKVKAEKNTSVLSVSVLGTNPKLVLASSEQLAESYKRYSGRKRSQALKAAVEFLNQQINLLRPKVESSRRTAETYANRYTLTAADSQGVSNHGDGGLDLSGGLSGLLSGVNSGLTSSGGSLKSQQAALHRQILELRYQLARVRRAGPDQLVNVNSSGSSGVLGGVLGNLPNTGSLQDLDRAIAERRSRLTDKDETVQSLLRQRRVTIAVMNRQLALELENSINLAKVQLASLQRPPGVIETFQEISRQANRNESTLLALQNKLSEQQLELARKSEPWELISSPTLSGKPVLPSEKINLAFGLLAGLITGAGAALWRDRRSGLVHHLDELLELLPYPLLGQLNSAHSERWQGVLELLAHGPLAGAPQVAVVAAGELGERAQHFAAELQRTLQTADPAAQALLTADLVVAGRAQAQLLVAGLGIATSDALKELHNDLTLQARPVAGLVLLSDPAAGDDA